jgi:hypothetical protein
MTRVNDNDGESWTERNWKDVRALLSTAGGGAIGGTLGGPLGAGVLGSITGAGAGAAAADRKNAKEDDLSTYDKEERKDTLKALGLTAGTGVVGQYIKNEYGETIEETALEGMNAASEGFMDYAHEVAAHAGDAPKSAAIGVAGLLGAGLALGAYDQVTNDDEDYDL